MTPSEPSSAKIAHVSADAANWIASVVAERCPDAVRVADPFHVVQWATGALDEERRSAWNRARKAATENESARGRGRPAKDAAPRPDSERAKKLKNSRYALWKNPEDLTDKQQVKLAWIVETDPALGRAYYLKEGLRTVFKLPYPEAVVALDRWVNWARRCRIPAFVKLQRSIVKHRSSILASIEHGLSNVISSPGTGVHHVPDKPDVACFRVEEAVILCCPPGLLSVTSHRNRADASGLRAANPMGPS